MRTDETMTRRLGLPSVIAICMGAMFSSGFFLLPGLAAQQTGPTIPLAYLVAGIIVLPALLSLAELSSAMPRSGGPYLFLARGLGPLAGVIGGIGKYVSLLFKGAFAFVGVGAYLSLVVDVPIQPVALALVAVFTAVNLAGVKQTVRIEIWLVAVLFVILLAYVGVGALEVVGQGGAQGAGLGDAEGTGQGEGVVQGGGPGGEALFPGGLTGFFAAVALVFVSYSGVGQVASASEEIRDPARNIPLGMLIALVLATAIYVAGTLVMVALLGSEALRGDPAPVASAAERFTALPFPTVLVVAAALAAFISTGNAAILSAARYPLAMGRDHVVGERFARVSERGVPRTGVLVTGAMLGLAILLFDVEGIAKLASAFLLLVFAGVCLAVVVFRESGTPEYEPGFRSPAYPWMHLLGALAYVVLIVESGMEALGMILLLLVGGGAWYAFRVRGRVDPSGAIYRWFGRLAEQAGTIPERAAAASESAGEPHGRMAARPSALRKDPLRTLLEGAAVLEMPSEEAPGADEVVHQAAAALSQRVGGDPDALARDLSAALEVVSTGGAPGFAVSAAHLEGIEQPEVVLVRVPGGVEVEGRTVRGLAVLVDDVRAPGRMRDTVSGLESAVRRTGFGARWSAAEEPAELRRALLRDVQVLAVTLGEADGSGLVNVPLRDANLPRGVAVALVRRRGASFVPHGDDALEAGDEVTLVIEAERIEDVERRFR